MKKLLIAVLSLVLMHSAFADNTATLRIKVSGTEAEKQNTYFLCVAEMGGCVSLYAGDHGKTYPMNPGAEVNYMFIANGVTYRMYPHALPDSCHVTLKENQTLTVSGKLVKKSDADVHIQDLHCTVG